MIKIRTRKLSVYGGEIQIMIPQYGELNRIYSDFIISHAFSFERQKFITDFYKQYNDTKAFEAAILERNAMPDQRERQVDIADLLLEEILKERQLNMENLFVKNGVE